MDDPDAEVAMHACRVYLASAAADEKPDALRRLVALLPRLEWMLCAEAEDCILDHFESAREMIEELMRDGLSEPSDKSPKAHIQRSL
jgi:hypothetical protein